MKKLFVLLALCATPALAQISVSPGSTPAPSAQSAQPTSKKPVVVRAVPVKAAASPSATATPEPKKKKGFFGFFRRIFGGGEEKPAVAAKPTPAPAVRKPGQKAKPATTPKATPATEATAEPSATPKPEATPEAAPKPTPEATPEATPKPKPTATPKATPVSEATPEIPMPVVPQAPAIDTDKVKKQALKDAHVKELQEKMTSLLSAHPEGGPEYKAAALEYTEALFRKMRQIDPSHQEQITRKENATKRRLEAGLPIVQ